MKYSKNYLHYKMIKCMGKFRFESPVLEVGCGTGETMETLAKDYDIKGVDLSHEAASICLQKGFDVREGSFLDITENFNSIVCADVLEHIEDDSAFVRHMHKILNNKGRIFIMVPSGRMMNDDLLCGHYRRYSKKAIIKLLEENNFVIQSVEMFGYPVIYYTRLFMNFICRLNVEKDLNLQKQTLKSSYEGPFDRTIYARIFFKLSKIQIVSKLMLSIMALQDLFAGSNKGWAVVVVANKL